MKYVPSLEPSYIPMITKVQEFKEKGTIPFAICVERNKGYRSRYDLKLIENNEEENAEFVERIIKTILWVVGGFKIYLGGDAALVKKMQEVFSLEGTRAFDADFMTRIYDQKFEVIACEYDTVPASVESSIPSGGHLDGCRIGFDAGGSDRKVSAVVNGEAIYSEEVVWFPKTNEDPEYHYQGILDSFKRAASKMPRVDAIGVSSAGVYVDNEVRAASLFIKVPRDKFDAQVRDIYIRAAKEIGDVPLEVANDGDVTALAGALELKDGCVLGIAMGTSEAAGYINKDGNLNGWLSELAFAPVDFNKGAMEDEWSGDYGCGVKYFSQDGIIKLAGFAGIELPEDASPAEKLKVVQKLMAEGNPKAKEIYENIGTYLGYTVAYYSEFYDIKYLLLLGRVTSGDGGLILIEKANEVLKAEFPHLSVQLMMPDENSRRVGQSIAAASLPTITK